MECIVHTMSNFGFGSPSPEMLLTLDPRLHPETGVGGLQYNYGDKLIVLRDERVPGIPIMIFQVSPQTSLFSLVAPGYNELVAAESC